MLITSFLIKNLQYNSNFHANFTILAKFAMFLWIHIEYGTHTLSKSIFEQYSKLMISNGVQTIFYSTRRGELLVK